MLSLALLLCVAACQTPPSQPAPGDAANAEVEKMTGPGPKWSVSFADGSGNGFFFAREGEGPATFSYDPVDPLRSSSGTYSGGSPRKGELSADAEKALWKLLDRCAGATAEHAPTRSKGTGAFDLESSAGKQSFLLARGDCLRDVEAFMAEYRGPAKAAAPQLPLVFVGVAQNAKMGAVLVTDEGELWVDLHEWPDSAHGKKVRVTGVYQSRKDLPVFVPKDGEPAVAGIPVPAGADLDAAATRRVLTEVKWEVLP